MFGNLLPCINMHLVYDDGWLNENPETVQVLNTMAIKSLNHDKDKGFSLSTNLDGAFLIQLMLQYFKSPTYDDYFGDALQCTTERIKHAGLSDNAKVSLIGNYLSAFIYSAEASFKYMEQESILEAVFHELFTLDKSMFHGYHRKLYLIGLGQCLFSDYIPKFVSDNIVKIISKMILMLGRLNLTEKYKEK